jgi:hypothetical protein
MSSPGIQLVLRQVHDGEAALEQRLHAVADRHRGDHEVRHVCVDLARWSLQNRQALVPLCHDEDPALPPALLGPVRASADLVGGAEAPGLMLLHDLRELYLMASGNSVLWTMLGQAAQTTKDADLLRVVTECHGRAVRQAAWCNATVKAISPQVLTAL